MHGFVLMKALEKTEKSRTAKLAGNQNKYRAPSLPTRAPMRKEKERLCQWSR